MAKKTTSSANQIEIPMEAIRMPVEIPLEPVYYSFLLDAIANKEHKKCMKDAIARYRKSCRKAGRQLIKDLKKCKRKFR
jgi:hypothetical protein